MGVGRGVAKAIHATSRGMVEKFPTRRVEGSLRRRWRPLERLKLLRGRERDSRPAYSVFALLEGNGLSAMSSRASSVMGRTFE
jgi:hypothetical protein